MVQGDGVRGDGGVRRAGVTRERAGFLARPDCAVCGGFGWWLIRSGFAKDDLQVCGCVWRAVYRECREFCEECRETTHDLRCREFVADFDLTVRRERETRAVQGPLLDACVGRALSERRPYGLYPLAEYFAGRRAT